MKLGFLLLLPLLMGPPASGPAVVRVAFKPLTKSAYSQAKKGCIATKPRVTFPLKKERGRIVIPTAKGPRIFRDSRLEEDNPDWEQYEYLGYLPQVECHLVLHHHYEWSRTIMLGKSGQQLVLQDEPAFSPSLNRFVAISAGLKYWANDNYVQLFQLENHAWRQVWRLTPKTWEPDAATWSSDSTLLLGKRMWTEKSPGNTFTYFKLVIK